MALLTLAQLLQEVVDEIPGKEQEVVVRSVNKVIRRIQTEFVEPQRSTFTTRPVTESGTVTATQDATLVTFSGTPLAATDPVMLIEIEGDATRFHLAFATSATGNLSSKWAEATGAGKTYTIAYPTMTFPASVGEILKIEHDGFAPLEFRPLGGCPDNWGESSWWSPYYHDEASATPNDDLTRVFLGPAPQERRVYSFWFKPRTTFLDPAGATTQTIPFSNLWYEAIVEGTLMHAWGHEGDKSKVALKSALFEAALSRSRGSQLPAALIARTNRSATTAYLTERRPVTYG